MIVNIKTVKPREHFYMLWLFENAAPKLEEIAVASVKRIDVGNSICDSAGIYMIEYVELTYANSEFPFHFWHNLYTENLKTNDKEYLSIKIAAAEIILTRNKNILKQRLNEHFFRNSIKDKFDAWLYKQHMDKLKNFTNLE
jgi:hypothetical protein